MSSIQSVSYNTYGNTPVLDPSVPPAVDAPKDSPTTTAVSVTVAKPRPQDVTYALYDLVKNTYPRLDRRQSMTAEGQAYKQKALEASLLKNVFANLLPLQADPEAAMAQLIKIAQDAQGKGPDAVLETLTAAKDSLLTPKIQDAIRNSPSTLGGAKENWSDAQRGLYNVTRSLATYEQHHLRGLATKALSNVSNLDARIEGLKITRAIQRMVIFFPHDLDGIAEAKKLITEGIKDNKESVATVRSAADALRSPALDDLVRRAPTQLSERQPEEWTKEDRRVAWLMRGIQRADFDWAASLNNFVIPDTPRRSPA